MEDPERPGRRLPAVGGREADESQTRRPPGQQTGGSVPRPVPRQAPPTAPPTAPPRAAPGVPMAGRSFAQRQAEMARAAKGIDTHPPPPVPRERPQPPVAAPPSDLDEDFDLDEEPEVYYEEEASPVSSAPETPSRIYSTRRALAEQVNEEVGQHQYSEEASGLVAIRERREAWKKTVKDREQEGRSPYIVRWAKVSFFPFLYMVITSNWLVNIAVFCRNENRSSIDHGLSCIRD